MVKLKSGDPNGGKADNTASKRINPAIGIGR